MASLPPAYVVRREGNSFTLFVSPHLGGLPISHNALQHYPEFHGADTWGVPSQVQLTGGYPASSGWGGGTLPVGTLPGGYPAGGYHVGYLPPSQVRTEGGTQLDNRRSTHYTAGGMPLAFTQEDFLVLHSNGRNKILFLIPAVYSHYWNVKLSARKEVIQCLTNWAKSTFSCQPESSWPL